MGDLIIPAKLSVLEIDVNKDWLGYIIKNLGAPVDPNDSLRKTELDTHTANASAHHVKTTTRGEITDFWGAPFWVNIPDKPFGLKKVAEVDVAVNTTTITITGLDINTDKFYLLLFKTKNPTATDSHYYLFVEGDLTIANYYNQYIAGSGTTVSAARASGPSIIYVATGERGFCAIWLIRDPDGYPRYYSSITRYPGASITNVSRTGSKTATVINITRIDLQASVADAIGAGSKLIIYGASG